VTGDPRKHPEYRRTVLRSIRHAEKLFGSCEPENEATDAKAQAVADLKAALEKLLEGKDP
jgi:hypothetical protein